MQIAKISVILKNPAVYRAINAVITFQWLTKEVRQLEMREILHNLLKISEFILILMSSQNKDCPTFSMVSMISSIVLLLVTFSTSAFRP